MDDEQVATAIAEAAKKYAVDCGAIYDIEGFALEQFMQAVDSILTQQRS